MLTNGGGVSKKRNKNARKKVVRKKTLNAPPRDTPANQTAQPEEPPPAWTPAPEEIVETTQQSVVVKQGVGAIGTFRTRLTPGAGRDGDTLLTKRRSLGELSLWLGGAWALLWMLWKLIQLLTPTV